MSKKKCVLIGTGSRGVLAYVRPIVNGAVEGDVEMCGVCDAVRSRAEVCSREYGNIPVFDDFDVMLDTVKPDLVFVTTMDANHHEYVIRALDKGYDVVTEKPMTNSRKKALAIMEAEKRTGKKVRVIFNMRYMRPVQDMRRILMTGVIGEIRHVDFTWMLDRSHGASYFRRWHRYMRYSNSLLLHKSTHHFDVVNWLLGERMPQSVFARGALEFYGKNGPYHGECCHKCAHAAECPFYFDVCKDDFDRRYYYDVEKESGYYRDGCVFAPDIDSFDRVALQVLYEGGVTMNYSLTCYNPEEGYRIRLLGTKGRLEFDCYSGGPHCDEPMRIRVLVAGEKEQIIETAHGMGTHGGADSIMLNEIINGCKDDDPLGRIAGSLEGYASLAIGDMAVQSILTGKEVAIGELGE